MRRAVSVQKARPELIRRRHPHAIAATLSERTAAKRVALVVIEQKIAGRRVLQQAAGDRANALRDLIRIRHPPLRM